MRHPVVASFLISLSLASLGTVKSARAEEPEARHRYTDDRDPARPTKLKTIAIGAAVTTVFYLPVLGASYLWPDSPGAGHLRAPVVGPWMTIGKTRLCKNDPGAPSNCSDAARIIGATFLALDGIGQAGGVAIMIEGLFLKTQRYDESASYPSPAARRAYYASHSSWVRERPLTLKTSSFSVSPVPSAADTDLGLSFLGTF